MCVHVMLLKYVSDNNYLVKIGGEIRGSPARAFWPIIEQPRASLPGLTARYTQDHVHPLRAFWPGIRMKNNYLFSSLFYF